MSEQEDDFQITSPDFLNSLLGFNLRLAHMAVTRRYSAALKSVELAQVQSSALQMISDNEGISQIGLASALGTDRTTVMSLVDRLQEKGLVTRRKSPSDRRRQELYLTEHGKQVLAQANELIEACDRKMRERFSPEELAQLTAALKRIHER